MSKVYKNAVENIPSVAKCYKVGLRALGANSRYVTIANTSDLNGSVFLDTCLKGENIWDYSFGYNDESYYMEVHPAYTNEVDTVIAKFKWLKNWLSKDGASLNAINVPTPFHWIASGKVSISPRSAYANRLARAGLAMPKSRLVLK